MGKRREFWQRSHQAITILTTVISFENFVDFNLKLTVKSHLRGAEEQTNESGFLSFP